MSVALTDTDAPANGHTTRRLETRRKLLEAGTALLADAPLVEVTSTAIAQRAGVATGTFYLHFADKHALFDELVAQVHAEMREQLRPDSDAAIDPAAGDGTRRARIEAMLEVAERRRELIRAVFHRGDTSGLADRVRDRIAAGLESVYADGFRRRGIDLHPGAAAQARAAALVRVIAWWAEDPARARRDEVADLLHELDPIRLTPNPTPPPAEERRP